MKTYYHTARWRLLSMKMKREAGFRCQECYKAGALETHHKIPVLKGGDFWNENNLKVLCRTCHIEEHRKKTDKQYNAWIKFRDELR